MFNLKVENKHIKTLIDKINKLDKVIETGRGKVPRSLRIGSFVLIVAGGYYLVIGTSKADAKAFAIAGAQIVASMIWGRVNAWLNKEEEKAHVEWVVKKVMDGNIDPSDVVIIDRKNMVPVTVSNMWDIIAAMKAEGLIPEEE